MDAFEKADLSPATKKEYVNRLTGLEKLLDDNIKNIILLPERYLPKIKDEFEEVKTLRNILIAILAVFKYDTSLKQKYESDYDKWFALFKQTDEIHKKNVMQNEPTEKQRAGMIEYKELAEKMKELPKGSMERLLLAMYGLIPPLRNDFNDVRIFWERVPPIYKNKENYIVITKGDKPAYLVLNNYKTSKTFGQYNEILPDELESEIIDSMIERPRMYLFEDSGKPYNDKKFSQWAIRVFKKIFNKPLTISLIRHAYINSLDFNKLTIADKDKIAKKMLHSLNTQDTYRLIDD